MSNEVFWGYTNEQEARKFWPELDSGEWSVTEKIVSTRGKKCIGSLDGKIYTYEDGSKDQGQTIRLTTVRIGNNKICF